MKTFQSGLAIVILFAAAILVIPRLVQSAGGVAPTPAVFGELVSLEDALEQSGSTGRPVLAVVTADWCGPCQTLKRGALSDAEVSRLVSSRAIPVYVDENDAEGMRMLPVRAYPTSFVIDEGKVTAKLEGSAGAGDYLAWLSSSLPSD